MKTALLLLAVIACASALAVDKEWEDFKLKFSKKYSAEEDAIRHKVFLSNLELIAQHNKKFEEGKVHFQMGINKFADMTSSDTSYLRGYKSAGSEQLKKTGATFKKPESGDYPESVDWRDQGYVTGVKDQGQCGSCWSFSAVGSLEGQHFAATGDLVSLSEQNLVDCVGASFGCFGGNMVAAFHYIKENGGIDTEESYPYEAKNNDCRYDAANSGATCAGHVSIAHDEEELLAAVVLIGPISVAIDASNVSFQLYANGVYYEEDCSTVNLDHGVLVVGYGVYEGVDFWLVKNSWGSEWGMEGYIMMSRNRDNNCGIVTEASYPLV